MDSIGAFTTTNTSIRFGSYPFGTTDNYQLNSSSAVLTIPTGSSILYAELIWGGTYSNGNVNLVSAINNPVLFVTPAGIFDVTPDTATYSQFDLGNGALGYVRSANITALIQQGGAGTYSTGRVVGTITLNNDSTANHAGWTLAVIYQNASLPFRNMSLRVGAVLVQSNSAPVTTTLTGFATPVSGALGGRALFSAQEGDANRTGDQALFGPTTSALVALSGPNNLANNFFASQINNDLGQLNTTGTFGTRNQTNGAPGTNISGGRQGWDITNVDISARLVNNQTSAVLRLTTSGDAYVLNANAIQVDINAPRISVAKSANVNGALVGDTITYTVTVTNTGTANATDSILTDIPPTGGSFVPGSVRVGGAARPSNSILSGVPLGTLAPGASITITYNVLITGIPSQQLLTNVANISFNFQSFAGGPINSAIIPSNTVTIPVFSPLLSLAKSASTSNAVVGGTITYTIQITNNGNVAANTTVTDPTPTGTTFVPNSVTLNGTPLPGSQITSGVNIGSLAPGATAVVRFQVTVPSLPSPPQLSNQAAASFTFQIPDGRTSSGSASSNTVTIPVALPSVTAVKSSNLPDAALNDPITYTIIVSNNGTEAVTDVVLTDPLQPGIQVIAGSVAVGGVPRASAAPTSGIVLGTLGAGSSITVSFQVLAPNLPSSEAITNRASVVYRSGVFNGLTLTNPVTIPVYQPFLSINKTVTPTRATIGTLLTYSFFVTNSGNRQAQAILTDPLPEGTVFVPGSVTVNLIPQPGASPQLGIALGEVTPGSTVPVTFQVEVVTIPASNRLVNQAQVSYSFQLPSGRTLTGYTALSNSVAVPLFAPNVSVTKSASTTVAVRTDTIEYNVLITNNGIEPISQVVLSDELPSGTALVPGSVIVDGTIRPGLHPASGIPIGIIQPGATGTVSFLVSLTGVPLTNPAFISNRANVTFNSGAFSGNSSSELAITSIYEPVIELVKSSSVNEITVGGTYTYQIEIRNSGNFPADVILMEPLPPSLVFVPNSVILNGFPSPGTDPQTGISLDTLYAGEVNTISFSVTVNELPEPQQLLNQASASYVFYLPDGRTLGGTKSSNIVTTRVSSPSLTVNTTSNSDIVIPGDPILYTSTLTNNGFDSVNQVFYFTGLPQGVIFVPGSVQINGVLFPTANPSTGIPIGTISPNETAVVTYEVITSMAVPPVISNQSTVSFTSGVFAASSTSNVVDTLVTQPVITVTKSANTASATLGDSIVYTFAVSNTGNLAAQVTLTDPIPAGTVFTPNTVVVAGTPVPGADPVSGIPVGLIGPGATVNITFEVTAVTLPSPQQVTNQATAAYTFVPPDGRTLSGSVLSNGVSFPISAPDVSLVLSTPTTQTTLNDNVTYSVVVTNNGIAPVANIVLSDQLPVGTTFVAGTVTVGGNVLPNATPTLGIPVGSLDPGASVTVTFTVQVTALPPTGTIANQAAASFTSGSFTGSSFSNILTTPVNIPIINAVKSAPVNLVTVGDSLTYSFTLTNTGNYGASATITDPTPAGTTFIPNSVVINGVPQPGASPITGIPVGVVAPGAVIQVSFTVVIDFLPSPQQLLNQASVTYTYTLPDGRPFSNVIQSNGVNVGVTAPNVGVVKTTATTATTVGDIITYTVNITNSGITAITNTIFTDPIPGGTTLVAGSVTVNGAPQPTANPTTGISLGTIDPGATVPVSFSVSVTGLPNPAQINNQSFVSFTSGAFSAAAFSAPVITPVYQPVLTINKLSSSSNATVGDTIVYTAEIVNTGNYAASATLTDVIPAGAALVPNSVIVNGTAAPGADPAAGILLGAASPGIPILVTFSVVVTELPPAQQLINQASIAFNYSLPDSRSFSGSAVSNIVTTPVSSPDVTVAKGSSFTASTVGDVIPYTIVITNNGIQNVTGVTLSDPLPDEVSFVQGSVAVNGQPVPTANPESGIPIGTITPGNSITVTFNVTVTALPAGGSISNQSSVGFSSGIFAGTSLSNVFVLPVYQPILNVQKVSNVNVATVGDTIVYVLTISNTGNFTASAVLTDPIPDGADFVPNSILINGVPQPGADPEAGIQLGNVAPNSSISVTATLLAVIGTLPSPQQLTNQAAANFTYLLPDGRTGTGSAVSNTVIVPVSSPEVSVVKSTSAINVVSGDVVTYSVVITNNGITTVNNVVFIDPIPQGSSLVAGSVTIDGVQAPNANPAVGVPIGSIVPGNSVTVTFQVLVA